MELSIWNCFRIFLMQVFLDRPRSFLSDPLFFFNIFAFGGRSTNSQTWFFSIELISYLIAAGILFEVGELSTSSYESSSSKSYRTHMKYFPSILKWERGMVLHSLLRIWDSCESLYSSTPILEGKSLSLSFAILGCDNPPPSPKDGITSLSSCNFKSYRSFFAS